MTIQASVTERPGRKLGLFAAIALIMGNMIGSGVFLLPASLAPYGWNAVLGWVVTIAGTLVLAWVFAALTRALPAARDPTGFVTEAFGELPELRDAMNLAWRILILWLAVLALFVLAGWVS